LANRSFVPFRVFWETACYASIEATRLEERRLLDPLILRVGASGAGVSLAAYMKAMEQRMAIAAASKFFFDRHDLLVGPVMPVPPMRSTAMCQRASRTRTGAGVLTPIRGT